LAKNANGASGRQPPTPNISTTLFRFNCSENSSFRVPDDLAERDQWVVWKREILNGRQTKVPYNPKGHRASSTDPSDWSAYQGAVAARELLNCDGIGFVFHESDPFVGIDLDDCLHDTTGEPQPCVRPMLERFGDTYMEVSPSGLGVKIFCRGKLPADGVGKTELEDGCAIEMYDRARYFTVTGNVFRNAPLQIEDHAADVISLFEALRGRGAARYNIPAQGKIRYGTQHLTLVSIAGTLRRRHICDEAIEACLQAVNRYQCERPGPDANISRIVRSSQRWGCT
jgi:hypothetical protein